MSELESPVTPDVERKSSAWKIIVVVGIILTIILLLIYKNITPKKKVTPSKPTQNVVDFLGDPITGDTSSEVGITTVPRNTAVPGKTKEGLFIGPQKESAYQNIIKRANFKHSNAEGNQLRVEGYENSWNTATPANYRSVIANARVKPWNTEPRSGWNREWNEGFSAEDIEKIAAGGATDGDDISKSIIINEIAFEATPFAKDPVSKTAIRNARRSDVTAALYSNALALRKAEEEAALKEEKANTFGYFVAAKGGIMEVDEPIPYIIIDGKKVSAPGIGGLGYRRRLESTQVTGGSVDAYAKTAGSQTGVYNTKSYYGYNPYSEETETTLPFGNTVFGYNGAPLGTGAVVVDVTGDMPAESEDNRGEARGDIGSIYGGGGYYTDSNLYADGISVINSVDAIALAGVISEEAEVEYNEELKKVADEEALASTDECSPILIYNKFIGLVEEDADDTTPISAK